MLKTTIIVDTIGNPDLSSLPDIEQKVFFESIYKRILELKQQSNK